MDCRGLVSIRPEFVGETSMVKLWGRGGKCERFRSLSTFIDTTINYYCMGGELLVAYINQKASPTYHFVVLLLCVFKSGNIEARFLTVRNCLSSVQNLESQRCDKPTIKYPTHLSINI